MTDDQKERVLDYLYDQVRAIVRGHISAETSEADAEEIAEACRALAPFPDDLHVQLSQFGSPEAVEEYLLEGIAKLYEAHEQGVGADQLRRIEQAVILRMIDDVWVDHIDAMEHLRESVRLRAYGQRDPLVEYKIEAHRLYDTLLGTVGARVADVIFKVGVAPQQQAPRQVQELRPEPEGVSGSQLSVASINPSETTVHVESIGRNDPCPCGSGKKFKKCGLLNTEEHQKLMAKK
jgi:preprotein translocase subunit SecA